MEQILCDHPVIILNPSFKNNLLKYKLYHTPSGDVYVNREHYNNYLYEFPFNLFSPRRNNITLESLDDFYVIDPHTGTTFPMYIQVPCGKCVICRDKKAREWSFRAMCENATAETQPIFVTLTYNNKHLPDCGIFKEEIQLFMKRLRIKLDRLNIKHNLRYFACGEYGTKSARPHYHMIIWNFPYFETAHRRLSIIESAWSVPTGQYAKNGSPITDQLGFCYCVPCESGAISYVMKYMRKEPTVPYGKNPTFFLSSRKNGGIGAAYAKRFTEYYRIHPDQLDMTVLDPYSGKQVTMSIPQYYKRIFFPCLSQCVTKEIRDAHKKLCYHISMRNTYFELMDMPISPRLSPMERKVLKRYSFLSNNLGNDIRDSECARLYKHTSDTIRHEYMLNELEIDNYLRFLIRSEYDAVYIRRRDRILERRTAAQNAKYLNAPKPDLKEVKYDLINKVKLAQLKEIF